MKNNIKNSNVILVIICAVFLVFSSTTVNAQKAKKARLKAHYTKVGTVNTLNLSGKYKKGRKYKPATGLDLKIYQVFKNDSLDLLGKVTLNKAGKGSFNLDKAFKNNLDSYNFKAVHTASKMFKKASKKLSIKVAYLNAELKTIDDKPFIFATLTDAKNAPVAGVELKVQLQRLFSPLPVGSDLYFTDEKGMINVPITRKMPGLEGVLNYEVVLQDNDDYGNIKSIVTAKIGTVIKDLSTFDERTMWSPPSKAPWADLIIPNILIFGIWGILFYLIFNLYRISKQKNA